MEHDTITNAFTVDVEDYFHVTAFERHVRPDVWPGFESRVERATHRLLDLLGEHGARGTFFVLGWVAQRFPRLVRTIQRNGHEIASHGYWHRRVYEQTPEDFARDLRLSRSAIEDATGERVTIYRAPSFSITRRSLWALDVLAAEGFQVDSSVVPVVHDRYGIPGASRFAHRLGSVTELPTSVARLGRCHVPVGGGGYFRLYPWRVTQSLLRRINVRDREPVVFYVHPWEVDPDQPRIRAPFRTRWRHYLNLHTTEAKLRRLLQSFRFTTVSECLAARSARPVAPPVLPRVA